MLGNKTSECLLDFGKKIESFNKMYYKYTVYNLEWGGATDRSSKRFLFPDVFLGYRYTNAL